MKIDLQKSGDVNVLRVSGGLDRSLRDRLAELIDGGERLFLFDLSELQYVDSSALGEMVACYKRATQQGGLLKFVVTPNTATREILALTHLDRVLQIFGEREEALAAFSG